MTSAGALLRIVLVVVGIWSLVAVLLAVPVAAVFRLQGRINRLWRQVERRSAWLEATHARPADSPPPAARAASSEGGDESGAPHLPPTRTDPHSAR
ncbi:MAG TPA: hypothetical protein VFG53_12165 [Anaeromyxobacter sp.]|nr:hypothetical protein [Anaeromyxobacter sp.]